LYQNLNYWAMKTRLLFPNHLKKVGWILLVPSTIMGILLLFFDYKFKFLDSSVFTIYSAGFHENPIVFGFMDNNYANTIAGVLFLVGALFVAFSKEKQEDEFIAKTRLESLLWATYVNYGILIFCFIFLFGLEFLNIMIFNLFTILIFFIIRFHYVLYKTKKSMSYEK
jgi:hypothetical protein